MEVVLCFWWVKFIVFIFLDDIRIDGGFVILL